jgi:hypothetical protein
MDRWIPITDRGKIEVIGKKKENIRYNKIEDEETKIE